MRPFWGDPAGRRLMRHFREGLDNLWASLRGRTSLAILGLADCVPPRPAIRARAHFGSLLCRSGSVGVEAASCG